MGRTDTTIIMMRQQFEDQLLIVEDGGEPMNVFRNPAAMPAPIQIIDHMRGLEELDGAPPSP